jgi:secondary thiamine-phosphate synthase enzyme
MAQQDTIHIGTTGRAFTDITGHVAGIVAKSNIGTGVVHLFVRHTSCSLVITENADSAVRRDLETLSHRWAPDGAYEHREEGVDDLPGHALSILGGVSLSVPINNGHLLLGNWQGIYIWEHRIQNHRREVVVTIIG